MERAMVQSAMQLLSIARGNEACHRGVGMAIERAQIDAAGHAASREAQP